MLETLETGEISDDFTDWFEISREEGRDADIGFERHWVDPTVPLAAEILEPAHGVLITSATLRDAGAEGLDWQSAEARTGALHLPQPPRRASFGSPFRYEQQSRIFIIKDVPRRDADALASAMRELFLAAGGGAFGTFHRRARAARNRGAHRPAIGRCGHPALRPACRPAGHRRAGGSVPRRGKCLPARHRCPARRRGCAGTLSATGGVRQGALAQAHDPAQGAARPLRPLL